MQSEAKPKHVVVIPDGNRRWAKEKGLPLEVAYDRGIRKLGDVLKWADEVGINIMTFWGFSTENAKRGEDELKILFKLFEKYLEKAVEKLGEKEGEVEVKFLGRLELFPSVIREKMEKIALRYSRGEKKIIFLMGYGGRQEIIDAINNLLKAGVKEVDEKLFSRYLYTKGLPDPDLLIRTSGEQRLSGCLPWQTVYTELYFCPKLWPDFEKQDFLKAIEEYKKRKRRFGK